MEQPGKERIAAIVRASRVTKGLTQQELADLTGITLRTVQRIESAEVLPRMYTLKVLEEKLGVRFEVEEAADPAVERVRAAEEPEGKRVDGKSKGSKAQRWILTVGSGLLILLLVGAFLAQSARFPETDFERLLLWGGVLAVYSGILLRVWR